MTTQTNHATLRENTWVRWGLLLAVSLTMFFAYMFVDVLSPIKTELERPEVLGWSSSVFGTYAGSEFFINVYLLFLIFAGIILDSMGIRFTIRLSGGLMVLGAIIKVYALSGTFINGGPGYEFFNSFWPEFPATAKLACIGFAIFGTGCEMAGVTVSRIIVKWFTGKELALAMGMEMSIARLGVFAVFWLSPYLNKTFESVQAPVIFCTALLVIAFLLYLVYCIFDKKLDEQEGEKSVESQEDEAFHIKDLKYIVFNKMFWIVSLLCVLFYSAIFPFQKFASDMLQSNLGLSVETAGQIFSLFPLGAVFITPLMGIFLDKKGKAATMLMMGSFLMFVCHSIFAFYDFDRGTTRALIEAIMAIVLLGLAFSLVPAALWPSVPKLIDNKVLGSAYSAIFFIQNIGLMLVPTFVGKVLDSTNPNVQAGEPKNFMFAMMVFASFGVLAFFLSLLLKIEDKKKGYGLEKPNAK
ncbi:MAG: MFS transporter [Porphyromonas sp.]|nr:MFS transporter [Porphyromonas sp.]